MDDSRFNRLASNVSEWDERMINSMISQLERYESKSDLEQWASWAPTVEEINRAIVEANCDAADG